ncbi:uncharacterized protein LOC119571757, partial [Penaeus monodon]|uniref:uncharacterized protein LOC119571757 n=1 Tax=Penaeus monodon TaxID=6687 RepID=UPI0018A7BC13
MYAHPRDCSKFVSCANSQPSTSSCPPNLVFNAAKKVCDWSENVQCTSTCDAACVLTIVETVTDAPVTGSEGTVAPTTVAPTNPPHRTDNSRTDNSRTDNSRTDNSRTEKHPPRKTTAPTTPPTDNTRTDKPATESRTGDWPQDEGCTDDEEASCTLSNPAAPPTLPNPNEQICDCECCLKPHPDDCTSYYYCAGMLSSMLFRWSSVHPEFKQCVLQTQFPQCQPEVPPTCDPTCECVYPAEVCSEYFKCNREGKPHQARMHGGLLFNDKIHSCDLPQNVECSGTRRKRSLT